MDTIKIRTLKPDTVDNAVIRYFDYAVADKKPSVRDRLEVAIAPDLIRYTVLRVCSHTYVASTTAEDEYGNRPGYYLIEVHPDWDSFASMGDALTVFIRNNPCQ